MRTVTSRRSAVVRAFRDAATHPDALGRRLLLDGSHLIRDAHAAGITLDAVAVSRDRLASDTEESALAHDLERRGIDVIAVSSAVMAALAPVRSSSGIVALGSRAALDADHICAHHGALIVAAVDVQDPGNLGALVRAAEAGGATGVLVTGASARPFSWKALRGSMGSVLRLPTTAVSSTTAVFELAQRHALRTVASVPRHGRRPEAIDWKAPSLLFVGSEGGGLPDEVARDCSDRVTIPMQPPVESLNVAVAAALLVYEARRQRTDPVR